MASDYSPETRQDRITQTWVAFAPTRSERPSRTTSSQDPIAPEDDPLVEGCPFCPGHEEMLPSVLWQLDDDGNAPWRTRVVPNKYPALTPDAPAAKDAGPLYESRPNAGRQEVIVDTPFHHHGPSHFTTEEMDALLRTYLERYHDVRQSDTPHLPVVFRNHGATAGASINHPHSQLVAIGFEPPHIQREEAAAQKRFEETGRCPYCTMIEEELHADSRVVTDTDDFVAFIPYAAQAPYELWILPRRHEPEFGRTSADERTSLAALLQDCLARLHQALDDPDYNYFVRTALEYESNAPHLHWSLRIRPRVSVEAGFELATRVQINPSIPERDAAVLRAAT